MKARNSDSIKPSPRNVDLNGEVDVNRTGFAALLNGGPDGIARIRSKLFHRDARVRMHAAWALSGKEAAVPLLRELLRAESDYHVRSAAITALKEIGPPAIVAAPELIDALRDAPEVALSNAECALMEIGPAIIPHLVTAIGDGELVIQKKAVVVLKHLRACEALPALVELGRRLLTDTLADRESTQLRAWKPECSLTETDSEDPPHEISEFEVIWEILAYCRELRADAAFAVPFLMSALEYPDADVVEAVARTLGFLGPAAKPAFSELTRLLDHRRSGVRQQALRSLSMIEPTDETVLAAARTALMAQEYFVRSTAAWTLARAGQAAAHALPELLEAQRDPDDSVRQWAMRAVSAILPNNRSATGVLITEWDAEAAKLIRQLKLFYLLYAAYRRGHTSLRKACDAVTAQLISRMLKERVPTTYPHLADNIRKLNPLFSRIFNNKGFQLFLSSKWVEGEAYVFTEDARKAWEWTDGFLRRQRGDAAGWYGLTTLPD